MALAQLGRRRLGLEERSEAPLLEQFPRGQVAMAFPSLGLRNSAAFLKALSCVAALVVTCGSAAAAEYKLQPGDTVEITVQGVPELQRKATIREDGYIPFPMIGNVNFVDLTLSEVRDSIRDKLIEKDIVAYPDVTVDLTEVRPMYILGNVARPGMYPFKPEYTVRHALSLAGGVGGQGLRSDSILEAAQVAGEFEALRVEFVRYQAKVRRLQAELAGKTSIDFGTFSALPFPETIFKDIKATEERHLGATLTNIENDRAAHSRELEQAKAQLEALEEQQQTEDTGLKQQTEDVERIKSLSERGMATSARVIDEQRSILLSKGRLMQTMAQVASVRRSIEELRREIDKSLESRNLEALKELQEALVNAETVFVKMQTTQEKMSYFGSPWQSDDASSRIRFVIHRKQVGKDIEVVAQPGTTLMPGDVIEVLINRPTMDFLKPTSLPSAEPPTNAEIADQKTSAPIP